MTDQRQDSSLTADAPRPCVETDRSAGCLSILQTHDVVIDIAKTLPPLPGSVVKLAAVVSDNDSTLDDVLLVLREDVGLVTAVLAEANSAASGSSTQITTLEAALVRIGLGRLLALSCATTIGPLAARALVAYRLPAGALWRHSVIASYAAESIFRLLRGSVGPHVVTSALLHDIGRMVLNDVLDRDLFAVISRHMAIEEAERELLDLDHAEVGSMLLQMWGIPRVISDAVANHHNPAYRNTDAASVVSLASHLANEIQPGPVAFRDDSIPARLAKAMDLDIEQVVDRTRTMLEAAGQLGEPQ